MTSKKDISIDSVLEGKLFSGGGGEVSEALSYVDNHLVPLSGQQIAGITLLKVLAHKSDNPIFSTIAENAFNSRNYTTGPNAIIDALDRVSLFQQLKGMRLNVGGGGQ